MKRKRFIQTRVPILVGAAAIAAGLLLVGRIVHGLLWEIALCTVVLIAIWGVVR